MPSPVFATYVVSACLLILNLLGTWILTGATRGKTKTTMNEEDARTILQGSRVTEEEPAEIQRTFRVHANALANIVPFLFLGQLYLSVVAPKATMFLVICVAFTVARYAHSVTYRLGLQPWRSVAWMVGLVSTLALMGLLLVGVFA